MNRKTALAGLILFGSMLHAQVTPAGEGLNFFADLRSAEAANSEKKPYVLYFGATWCRPCKRMKSITFEVLKDDKQASKFQWLKFDVDESPEVATQYRVVSVPAIVVLDADQNAVGVTAGFLTADKLLGFIQDSLDRPQKLPPSLNVLVEKLTSTTDDEEAAENVKQVLTELADIKRPDRSKILTLLASQPATTQRLILALLKDGPLALRAAATEALAARLGAPIEYDPFAPAKDRTHQFETLKAGISFTP